MISTLGLPVSMTEVHFAEFETLVQQKLGFEMNEPQRQIMRTIAGLKPTQGQSENIMIQAAPGAGKTTLIVMVTMLIDMMKTIGLIREYPKILALSHMRQNRAMLENYLPNWVDKSTVHKLGWSLMQKMSNRYTIAKWKIPNITHAVLKQYYPMGIPLLDEDNILRKRDLSELYWELSRIITILITSLVSPENIIGIEWLYDVYTPNIAGLTEEFNEQFVESIAPDILRAVDSNRKESGHISFEEMVTVPIRAGWFNAQYDIVLVDEGQDLSPAQQIIVERTAQYKFVVGDRNQALMKFAGADTDSWNRLSYILDASIMTMPITQRCPVSVVGYLQSIFKEVVPRKDAKQGKINILDDKNILIKYADRIATGFVCRTHADVAEAYVMLMEADIKTSIVVLGADVYNDVKNTVAALERLKGIMLPFNSTNFLDYLDKWTEREWEKAKKIKLQAQSDVKKSEIRSKSNTVRILFDYFNPSSPKELVDLVGMRFGTSPDGVAQKQDAFKHSVVIGTVYAWKGLETSHIVIFNTDNYLDERGTYSQEKEVLFVAMSRAKDSLSFYPEAPINPVTVDYDVQYQVQHNNTLPYPNFDTSLFGTDVELVDGAWTDLSIWKDALED